MHFTQVKGILSAQNGTNLYRGCTHGCIYCDSRSDCYNFQHDFEDIEVKSNACELLEQALLKKRKKCMIGTGSMCDPYMHCERELLHTRKQLELILHYGFGATLITKSDLVLRDLDLLAAINAKTKCVVQMTLTTCDEALCRIVEPHVCTTKRRFEVLKALHENGIPTVVWLCPILPFINDTPENLRGILSYCEQAHVYGILNFGMGLTLRVGNREYYYSQLDRHFPGLKQKYVRTYGLAYEISSPNATKLAGIFREECRKAGIRTDIRELFAYLSEFPEKEPQQLSLF